ncbi:hypothetical protein ERC79_20595 [Rhodococcus sp. ABRD24]|uniref:hypothetical protein n=1 Tax=Rhodococcus sp. ABRD24 TaxID=2507582 RepID=UPI00103C1B47|nr:hypothetical protein [Rhodococcus sp. ABRD24]QBJ98073.1 hypothetical protein ERC79_20595 [Rhodococcus sp. ABRD24]
MLELIVQSYKSLEDSITTAFGVSAGSGLEQRLAAGPLAYRVWAIEHRRQFNLIFFDQLGGCAAPPAGPTVSAQTGVLQPIAVHYEVQLGPNAEPAVISLGVGMTSLPPRRKLAFLCPDWSHDRAHLGGALGAVVMTGLLSRDWIRPVDRSRSLELTPAGHEGLATYFAV